jgi:hypothetical protein
MILLKSKLAWKRWCKKAYLHEPTEPVEFPCFAMTVCTSCAYEESDGFYLYMSDLTGMADRLRAQLPHEAEFREGGA